MKNNPRWGLVPTASELQANFRVLIVWRWITGAGAIALAILGQLVPDTALRPLPLILTGVFQLIFNVIIWSTLNRWPSRLVAAAYAQVIVDLATLGLIFHFTGGVESPSTVYLVIHLFGTGLLLSRYASVVAVCAATGIMAGIALLEYERDIPHITVWNEHLLYRSGWFIGTVLLAFFLSTLLLVLLGVAVASRLRRQEREAVALYRAAQVITSTLDADEVLNRLLETCGKTLGATAGIVRLLSADDSTLNFAASYGLSERYIEKGSVDVVNSPMDLAATHGRTTIIEDVRSEDRVMYKSSMLAEGIRSGLVMPIPGADGRVLGVLRVYSASPRRFSQRDVPFMSAITAQAGIALNNAIQYQTLAQIDEAKSRFLRTVTHELRSPVAGAQSLMRNLTQGFAGELTRQQCDILLRIESRLDFLQELITDLLDLAAGRERRLIPAHEGSDLLNATDSLRQVIENFKDQAQAKEVRFSSNVDVLPELWVRAEPESMRRILANLVSNAIKYTPSQGRVEANLGWDEDWLEFKVTDSGIGIPEEDQPHLFEEFYRARNARQSQPLGTGLGLALVKQLVTQLDGQIAVRSVEGDGSTFTVYLPLQAVGEHPPETA